MRYGQGKGNKRQNDGGVLHCVCPKCGYTVTHERGEPCTDSECPKCGTQLVGEGVNVTKQNDGYVIMTVSTVALPDLEGETFTTKAMDNDIEFAKHYGYPEFRVFHHGGLGIGKVTEMSRVGMFAVEKGVAYNDEFSLAVCKNMLEENDDGKWRVSRGFQLFELTGKCPTCGTELLLKQKHLVIGYKCPVCGETYIDYRNVLKDVNFTKVKTFDITITDSPAVVFTGAQAFSKNLEVSMNKELIREKLIEAGIDEELVNERMKSVSEDILKSLNIDAIPDALVLKEVLEGDGSNVNEDEYEEIDVKEFIEMITDAVTGVMKSVDIEVSDVKVPQLDALVETVQELSKNIDTLMVKDAERLKELVSEMPRNAVTRIRRSISMKPDVEKEVKHSDKLVGVNGNYASMTEFLHGGN